MLQKGINFATVARLAIDLFIDAASADAAVSPLPQASIQSTPHLDVPNVKIAPKKY